MKFVVLTVLGALVLTGCAERAYVNLENAPVSSGNINSREAGFGDIYLLDTKTNTLNYLANLLQEEDPKKGRIGVYTVEIGDKRATATSSIEITTSGSIDAISASAKAEISNSILFEIKNASATRFRYPNDVLNSKEVFEFRRNQARFANDRFRFLFIREIFSAKSIEYNLDKGSGSISVDVAGKKFDVAVKNGSSVACGGTQNACIVRSQVWRLKKTPSSDPNATGYKFFLDTEQSSRVVFHRADTR